MDLSEFHNRLSETYEPFSHSSIQIRAPARCDGGG